MTLDKALETLRAAESALRAKGVIHVGVFGSTARGDQNAASDLDVLVDFDPHAAITVYDYVAVKNDISDLLETEVDLVDSEGLKPHMHPSVTRDVVYAF